MQLEPRTLFEACGKDSAANRDFSSMRFAGVRDDVEEPVMPHPGPPFNARLLTLAREACHLTQTAMARELGISQPLVAKWEAGTAPTRDQLASLARVLRVSEHLFFIAPERRPGGVSEFYHRARQKARRGDIKAIHARCELAELQVDRLLDAAELPEDRIPDIDPDNHAGDAEKLSGMTRLRMGVPPGPIENLIKTVERCGGLVLDHNFEADNMDALCRWVPGLPKLFYLNANAPGCRMRLSLAHELGHTVMHFDRDVDFRLAEDQANRFAAAFMMPAADIRPDFGYRLDLAKLGRLKRKWKVSMQALAYRAHQLGSIDQTRFRSIFTQISRKGWRKTEPVQVARESPLGFKRLIQHHLDAGFSESDLARRLLVSPERCHEIISDTQSPDWEDGGVRLRLAR